MGTVAGKDEVVGAINKGGQVIRIVEARVERRVQAATNVKTRTLGDVVAAVLLLIVGIWIGRRF